MNKKKAIVVGLVAVLAVALCATASSLVWVCRKVRAFEAQHGGSVYENLSKAQLDERVKAEVKAAATNAVPWYAKDPVPPKPARPVASTPKKPEPPPPPPPMVSYSAPGRYLPPGGARAIGVEAVNVTNVHAQICRVVPANVVQLLAREESVYRRYSWGGKADDEETEELSGEVEEYGFRCVNKPNEMEKFAIPVAMKDGGPVNGIYLVAIRSADRPRNENWWADEKDKNPNRYRLVCLSDLGLSVRLNGTESPGVWVTSLMKGTPVDGVKIAVYSSANIKIMEGETDENGWSRLVRIAKGVPFAVIATSASGDDSTFIALRDSMKVDETYSEGSRPEYLAAEASEAFVWTERGIYRHDEKIMLHALLRNGLRRAPDPMPVEIQLVSPRGNVYSRLSTMTDSEGSVVNYGFTVPASQPSGMWKLNVKIPGKDGKILGSRTVKVEEFAPPQIRVRVEADATAHPSNFAFTVSGEHLFGGPAHALRCEGAVVFEDIPFEPKNWKGWSFGNSDRGLKPSFRRLAKASLDREGKATFAAPLWAESGLPKSALRATAQGTVFEDGGRPATSRATCELHYYPYYVGSTLAPWIKIEQGLKPKIRFACVKSDGTRLGERRRLVARLESVESVYTYRSNPDGWETWDCTRIRKIVADNLAFEVPADADAEFEIPADKCGDYVLTVNDPESEVSFAKAFYLSDWGDSTVRAPLSDPTAVTLTPDKEFYRVGETPRLMVRSPFAGAALVSVLRDKDAYTEILTLTNATSEIVLRPVTLDNAPNLDVYVSVVQSVEANAKHMAARAHGIATINVRPAEEEIAVKIVKSVVNVATKSGSSVSVEFEARGASAALVTVVDEGINILTDEQTPDPIGCFARPREALHPLYDIYHRILPVVGTDLLRVGNVKTGGGADEGMLGRVSPVPTRRFKPLAIWSGRVAVGADGKGRCDFALGEFVGEIRVTVVAWSDSASGAESMQAKVTPKVVMMPDAPRFVAPGDVFEATLPIHLAGASVPLVRNDINHETHEKLENGRGERPRSPALPNAQTTSNGRGERPRSPALPNAQTTSNGRGERPARPLSSTVEYSISVSGKAIASGKVDLGEGGHTNVVAKITAPAEPGELDIVYLVKGLGETHEETIHLPVRPAVAWVETSGIIKNEELRIKNGGGGNLFEKYWETEFDSPIGQYESALRWLADYPHGCLEQTASRVFPLITAGGILASVSPAGKDIVESGVRRVESMVRSWDFVMWPDCTYAPWDKEVSLYAAHFLVEAERSGVSLNAAARGQVMKMLRRWAISTNDTVSAYACHTLALARRPERDRMLRLYDASTNLTLLSRARLARAFALSGDRRRASSLLASSVAPSTVKDAAFSLMAFLEVDPDDSRVLPLVKFLDDRRDKSRLCWGTTEENAHALLAMGAYFKCHPPKDGEKFVVWRKLSLPKVEEVKAESSGIHVERRYLMPEGGTADLAKLERGEMVIVELALSVDDTRELADLVVEDLLPGCFEPVHGAIMPKPGERSQVAVRPVDWVMRSDARDDRMLVFSKRFTLWKGEEATFRYPVRVVSAGEYVLPGTSVEAMYNPLLRAKLAPGKVVVK